MTDDIHHRLHFVITKFLTEWRTNLMPSIKTPQLINNTNTNNLKNNIKSIKLVCDVIIDLIPNFETLSIIGRERFLENFENALRLNRINFNDEYNKLPEFLRNYNGFNDGIQLFYEQKLK